MELGELQEAENPPMGLLLWIGQVDRYFCAIDVLRGGPECPE